MTVLAVRKFVDKWKASELKEIAGAQSHFIDICNLVGHRTPTDIDTKGDVFTFEPVTDKAGGGKGRADVWYNAKFIWEYKRPHSNLGKAYDQLLLYRESLGNPPLLITSDTQKIIIHTNFTNTVKIIYDIDFDRLLDGDGLDLLKRAFNDPQSFKPDQTKEQVTKATANTFIDVAMSLQKWAHSEGHRESPEQLAHFIVRLLFSLFAEDMKILPDDVFTQLVKSAAGLNHFSDALRNLFATMRVGGLFGIYKIPHFDGGLFDDDFVPDLPSDVLLTLRDACLQDWSSIDPSIFGTLFERIIDESKRAQLGQHYTSQDDIMLIVEPVLMQPLRHQWFFTRQQATALLKSDQMNEAYSCLSNFATKIAHTNVLDPACGSGNFLYVALRQLLDLQKEVITFSLQSGLADIPLSVSPAQLYGLELNTYAHELAQVTVWIGYLQWKFENGFSDTTEPILRPLKNIQCADAIVEYDDGIPRIPTWPSADVIIGNPPFLGTQKMLKELGVEYCENLRHVYKGHLSGKHDLVCYWFENARTMIEQGKSHRVGLIATNSIRNGSSRYVLDQIKQTGNIFMAWSDHPWLQEGASVRVSIIGFDNGDEKHYKLDGNDVTHITSNLRSGCDLTQARTLKENDGISFYGTVKGGPFEINASMANNMIASANLSGHSNQDVIKPWVNGMDITRRSRNMWIIDFGVDMALEEAMKYEKPFEYVKKYVKPMRDNVRREKYKNKWWIFSEPCTGMREAIKPLQRFIITTMIAKYRIFTWLQHPIIPDQRVIVIARDDDYFYGVLNSKIHTLWALNMGATLEDRPSYSPTATFQTFPFPWPPNMEPAYNESVIAVATSARELSDFYQMWINPPDANITASMKYRTLTNLYNAFSFYHENIKGKHHDSIQWNKLTGNIISLNKIEQLDYIHTNLNHAVFDCYGWDYTIADEEILVRLLSLNLKRAAI